MLQFTNTSDARRKTGLTYLGSINSSAKILKNQKISKQYTYILYLSPSNVSGYNTCSHATKECKLGCLYTSGRAGMSGTNKILQSRLTKTKLFFEEQEFFMNWLVAEIKAAKNKAAKDNYGFSVRLNGTSDIDWSKVFLNKKNIFDMFPEVQFYDYTKNPNKYKCLPNNYHLTFSYTGNNWKHCEDLLKNKQNVAVIFNRKKKATLPISFLSYYVTDGDLTDYRPDDGQGVIVGLRWKRIHDKNINQQIKTSKFVIQ